MTKVKDEFDLNWNAERHNFFFFRIGEIREYIYDLADIYERIDNIERAKSYYLHQKKKPHYHTLEDENSNDFESFCDIEIKELKLDTPMYLKEKKEQIQQFYRIFLKLKPQIDNFCRRSISNEEKLTSLTSLINDYATVIEEKTLFWKHLVKYVKKVFIDNNWLIEFDSTKTASVINWIEHQVVVSTISLENSEAPGTHTNSRKHLNNEILRSKSAEYWLKEIAKHEEGQEFKPAFSYDTAVSSRTNKQEHAVLKTIAGMLNASGGRILIGIADDSSIIGLEDDFREFSGKDGFTKALDDIISHNLSNNAHSHIKIEFPTINDRTICIIEITPANIETWYINRVNKDEEFYIRRQGSTVQLKNKQITDYIRDRWK